MERRKAIYVLRFQSLFSKLNLIFTLGNPKFLVSKAKIKLRYEKLKIQPLFFYPISYDLMHVDFHVWTSIRGTLNDVCLDLKNQNLSRSLSEDLILSLNF